MKYLKMFENFDFDDDDYDFDESDNHFNIDDVVISTDGGVNAWFEKYKVFKNIPSGKKMDNR